ncbi:LysR substrate-binding domain-containing protein [Marinomonas sp.]|nr:LysR family transcriptional regulator [Marinomonas sp.]MDB4837451.1 LysR substrate-binding domain-containing protein [Marinomonas sp.]
MISNTLQQLDLKSLTGFLYLIEERHVGRAADRLSLSQSAMSRLLIRLRDAFDDPLFIRTAKEMVPTSRALELEPPVRYMLEKMVLLESSPNFVPQTSERTFHLKTNHYQAQAYVPAIAKRFYAEAPQAMLETTALTENSLLHQAENPIDAVLCSEYIQVPNSFKKRLLGREKFRCIMSATHPLAHQTAINLDDYLRYSHVLLSMGGGGSGRLLSDTLLGERAKERRFAFRTPYFLAALETVGETSLLMSTSGLLPDRFCQQFGLVIKELPIAFPDPHYYLCWSRTKENDPAVQWFKNIIAQGVKSVIPYPEN